LFTYLSQQLANFSGSIRIPEASRVMVLW
jgi:hypothetical protein